MTSKGTESYFEHEPDRELLCKARRKLDFDAERAIQELKFLASRGSVMSMVYIGDAFARGRGVKPDTNEAKKWFQCAANAGSAIAEHSLGRLYLKLEQAENAVPAFERAAAKDFAPSIYLLARLNFSGLGVTKNPQVGEELCKRAMLLGSLPAKGALAKHLIKSEQPLSRYLYALWLSVSVRIEAAFVLLTQGARSERFRM